jgi:hypothetical protein
LGISNSHPLRHQEEFHHRTTLFFGWEHKHLSLIIGVAWQKPSHGRFMPLGYIGQEPQPPEYLFIFDIMPDPKPSLKCPEMLKQQPLLCPLLVMPTKARILCLNSL